MMRLAANETSAASTGLFAQILHDERGASVMEFGLVFTVFITLMLGVFDLGHLAYTQSILEGAVQTAARSSSLETGDTVAADQRVTELVQEISPGSTLTASRVSYYDFNDIERAESWNDADNNGTCNDGETYSDENDNGTWDDDIGVSGNGGAGDVVLYEVTVEYSTLFPNPFLAVGFVDRELKASALKKNQPFADQAGYGSDAGTC